MTLAVSGASHGSQSSYATRRIFPAYFTYPVAALSSLCSWPTACYQEKEKKTQLTWTADSLIFSKAALYPIL